jgi:hypothetical protein
MKEAKVNYYSKYFVIILISFFSCSSNVNQQQKNEVRFSFLTYYQNHVLKKDSMQLLNNTSDSDYTNCLNEFMKKPMFKEFDKEDFVKGMGRVWREEDMPNASLLSSSDLPDFKTPESWRNFRNKKGNGYYVMSYPIVSSNLKYIAFYTAYYCGDRCGYGQFALYQKTSKGWEVVEKYCDWVS